MFRVWRVRFGERRSTQLTVDYWLLDVSVESLANFGHLWRNYCVAVALVWVLREKVLVVLLAHPESFYWHDLRYEFAIPVILGTLQGLLE